MYLWSYNFWNCPTLAVGLVFLLAKCIIPCNSTWTFEWSYWSNCVGIVVVYKCTFLMRLRTKGQMSKALKFNFLLTNFVWFTYLLIKVRKNLLHFPTTYDQKNFSLFSRHCKSQDGAKRRRKILQYCHHREGNKTCQEKHSTNKAKISWSSCKTIQRIYNTCSSDSHHTNWVVKSEVG